MKFAIHKCYFNSSFKKEEVKTNLLLLLTIKTKFLYVLLQCLAAFKQSVAHFLQCSFVNFSHSMADFSQAVTHFARMLETSLLFAVMALLAALQAAMVSLQSLMQVVISVPLSFEHMFTHSLQDLIHALQAAMLYLYISFFTSTFLLPLLIDNGVLVFAVNAIKQMNDMNTIAFFMIVWFLNFTATKLNSAYF